MKIVYFICGKDPAQLIIQQKLFRILAKNGFAIYVFADEEIKHFTEWNADIQLITYHLKNIPELEFSKPSVVINQGDGNNILLNKIKGMQWEDDEGIHYIGLKEGETGIDSLLKKLKITDDDLGWSFKIPLSKDITASDLPTSHLSGFLVLVLDKMDKPIDMAMWKEVFQQINHPVIIMGSYILQSNAREISSIDDVKIYNSIGKFNFAEMCHLVNRSKLVICGDNPWLYIAVALHKKVVALNLKKHQHIEAGYGKLFLKQSLAKPIQPVSLKTSWFKSKKRNVKDLVEVINLMLLPST